MALAARAGAALVGALPFVMSPTVYHIIHVFSLLVLTGGAFYGFAGPAETKKKVMMFTGIASVLMLISGVGLMHKLGFAWVGWPLVKVVSWLGLSALAGIGYRKREKAPLFIAIILLLVLAALYAVYGLNPRNAG